MKLVVPSNDNDNNVGDSSTQYSDIEDDDVKDNENDEEKKTDVEDDENGEEEKKTDVEDDEDNKEEKKINMEEDGDDWVADLPVPPTAIIQQHQAVATANGNVVLPSADPSNFDDMYMKNSRNVHLGNKTFDQTPVRIIKKVVYKKLAKRINSWLSASDENISDLPTNKADEPTLRQINTFCKVTQWLCTWKCLAKLFILALILMGAMEVYYLYFSHHPDSSLEEDYSIYGKKWVRFVKRNEWGAPPHSTSLRKLKLPVSYVIISHTATGNCNTMLECTSRLTQIYYKLRKWSDINYNFFVGGDGLAYVGRSWDYVGAHSSGYNNRSIGISFIGNFRSVKPPKVQLYAAQKIIEIGVKAGKIAPDYKLLGQRQVSKTLNPGEALYDILKTWPHWVSTP